MPFAAQSRDEPVPYSLPAIDHQRHAPLLPGHRRVVDRGLLAVRPERVAALDALEHLVADADVGEGAAHHHLVVAAPRAVGVELADRHLPLLQVDARRVRRPERARRRDVVGRHRVAEERQDPRPLDVLDHPGLGAHALEVRRVLHVGRAGRPRIGLARLGLTARQWSSPLKTSAYLLRNDSRVTVRSTSSAISLLARPDVLEVDRLAGPPDAERLGRQVDVHVAGERVGDDERRRGEIVRPAVRVDPPLEVAVAREHRAGDEVGVADRLGDRLGQRPRVADAGGAAVADEVEAERVEVLRQPRRLEVVADHLAARARATSSPRACASAPSPAPSARRARRRSSRRGSRCWCTT